MIDKIHNAARLIVIGAIWIWSSLVYASGIPGDVNGDGIINGVDSVMIQEHLLGRGQLTGDPLTRADANEDGNVNVADIVAIINNLPPRHRRQLQSLPPHPPRKRSRLTYPEV